MLLLAGLMGLMAVGATAFYAIEPASEEDEEEVETSSRTGAEGTGADATTHDNDGLDRLLDPSETGVFAPSQLNEPTGEIVSGGAEDDRLTGTPGEDYLGGQGGDDDLSAGDGQDQIYGGTGDDTLAGEGGNDTLHGEAGNDLLSGGDGDDHLFGHDGDDTLTGNAGDDSLVGGMGDDMLAGGAGDDAVHGYHGDDTLTGGAGADTLFGGWGDDVLGAPPGSEGAESENGPERNYLNGGAGDDLIFAGPGDVVTTGDGADSVVLGDWLNAAHQAEILDFAAAEDRLMILYDDQQEGDPEISLEADEEVTTRQHVLLNGVRIAFVENAQDLTLDHIVLLAQRAFDGQNAA